MMDGRWDAEGRAGVFDSYIVDCPADRLPAAGARLAPRPDGPWRVALHAGDGRPLGHLPPAEAQALQDCLGDAGRLHARVRAVVPGMRRPRVLVRFEAA